VTGKGRGGHCASGPFGLGYWEENGLRPRREERGKEELGLGGK